MFEKYDQSKLPWCTEPFTNEALGYCWGYAGFVDKGFIIVEGKKITDFKEYCCFCEKNKEGG
uniref:Uncharacterized protein n=1 Tax=viral metagenome TaxID=1070528 RepID=A0A6M3IRC8_9ZZZZ